MKEAILKAVVDYLDRISKRYWGHEWYLRCDNAGFYVSHAILKADNSGEWIHEIDDDALPFFTVDQLNRLLLGWEG